MTDSATIDEPAAMMAVLEAVGEAGVDIDKGNAFVEDIKDIVASTHQRGVLGVYFRLTKYLEKFLN